MAIAALIAAPYIRQEDGANEPSVQKDPQMEASSQAWIAGALVYTSGTGASVVLNELATAGTLIYGQSPDSAVGSGDTKPPNRLFGLLHYCYDVRNRIIEINIASATATSSTIGTTSGVTWAGGGTNGVALAVGQQYGVMNPTSGTYKGVQFLDVNNTTQKLFEIVALPPGVATTDNNPRIWVRAITTILQG